MSINNISNIILSGNPNTTLNIVDDDAAKQITQLQVDVTQLDLSLAAEALNRATADSQNATNIANLDSELAEKLRVKSGNIVTFTDVFVNGEFDVISEIEPQQAGSGDPSLNNIRPITGYDSIKLSRTGKNLFNVNVVQNSGTEVVNNGDGTLTVTVPQAGAGVGMNQRLKDIAPGLVVGETYVLSAKSTGASPLVYLYGANIDWYFGRSLTITQEALDSTVAYYAGAPLVAVISDIQIEPGYTATAYEPYNDNSATFTIDLGQTVYGGTFNWQTGELTIGWESHVFDGVNKAFDGGIGTANGNTYACAFIKPSAHQFPLCSHLKNSWAETYGYAYLTNTNLDVIMAFIKPFASIQEANDWLAEQYANGTPFTVCYELKDPITIQFPSHRISSIPKETNYLFGNTSITAQQNLAVNKAYVDKKLGDSGTNTVEGQYAVALGSNSTAYGDNTFVTGNNSTAYGNGSVAMGESALAGCMGYYIAAIDANQRYIYLSTITEEVTPVWENQSNHHKPDFKLGYNIYSDDQIAAQKLPTYIHQFSISANAYHHWVFAGDIIEINGNRIKYSEVNNLNGKDVDKNSLGYKKWISNYDSDGDGKGNAKPMKFYIPAQPHTGNITIGLGSHAEGWETIAPGEHSHAEGWYSIAAGRYAHAEGDSTRAGYGAHAEGVLTLASGLDSHAEGEGSQATGDYSHAEGGGTTASGKWSHSEGSGTVASGMQAHAEGANTQATGGQSHSEGRQTFATGGYAHAGGYQSLASGKGSFAHGIPITPSASVVREPDSLPDDSTKATGHYSVAIGQGVQATGAGAAAFGIGNHANYYGTFTYGQGNTASYWNALAGGSISEAKHSNSVSIGRGIRTSRAYQTAIGLWNKDNTGALFIIGNGTETSDKETGRSTAFAVKSTGDVLVGSKTVHTGADYAEFFEWQDGNPGAEDRIGYVVTLDEDKIRLAQEGEEILGIISGTAGVVGDGGAMDWQGRFVKDAFGRIIYDEVEEFEEHIDPETQETIRVSLGMAKHPRISPDYNPKEKYIPREERPEWACVGIFGKLYVRDDGTCIPNAYARCVNGVLTYSSERTNIKVMKRTNSNIVYVFLK